MCSCAAGGNAADHGRFFAEICFLFFFSVGRRHGPCRRLSETEARGLSGRLHPDRLLSGPPLISLSQASPMPAGRIVFVAGGFLGGGGKVFKRTPKNLRAPKIKGFPVHLPLKLRRAALGPG